MTDLNTQYMHTDTNVDAKTATKGIVSFVTMGCAKNEVDTSEMMSALREAGYSCDFAPENADVVIINTCSFIQAATEESIEAILDACELPRVRAGLCAVVVTGCMPARYGADLQRELPEVAGFVPCADEGNIVQYVEAAFESLPMRAKCNANIDGAHVDVDDMGEISCTNGESAAATAHMNGSDSPQNDALSRAFPDERMPASAREKFAYVKISDGCDRFCSFCTIPYIRGRYHSFGLERITRAIEQAARAGAREIVLIGQDTSRWGSDLEGAPELANLLEHVALAFPELRFRVMYVQPEGISDALIATVALHDNLCNYFDIPFQHVSPSILSQMNRVGSAQEFLALVARLRAAMPDVALRTTLMVGFPGETDAEFEQLLAFVEEAELDYVGAFAYSREEPARAAAFEGQVAEDVKLERLQELRTRADAVSAAVIARRIGSVLDVVVCGQEEDGQWYGRASCQAPEVDGITFISPDEGQARDKTDDRYFLHPGQRVQLHIDDTLLYDMEGHIING